MIMTSNLPVFSCSNGGLAVLLEVILCTRFNSKSLICQCQHFKVIFSISEFKEQSELKMHISYVALNYLEDWISYIVHIDANI